jgi:hypothetical protein
MPLAPNRFSVTDGILSPTLIMRSAPRFWYE